MNLARLQSKTQHQRAKVTDSRYLFTTSWNLFLSFDRLNLALSSLLSVEPKILDGYRMEQRHNWTEFSGTQIGARDIEIESWEGSGILLTN